jgi:DNA repair protein RadC
MAARYTDSSDPRTARPRLHPQPHDRPREKLARIGAAGLGDNELLAIVLGQGARRLSALEVANAVLERAGALHGVAALSRDELERIAGVGAARASQILAAVELGRRTLLRAPAPRQPLASPDDAAAYLAPTYGGGAVERFGVLLLDVRHRILRATVISMGSVDSTVAHPREVFREATAARASGVIVFHNHPSGDPTPSDDDVRLTERLRAAGEIIGIPVLDHLILTDGAYYSFRRHGRL